MTLGHVITCEQKLQALLRVTGEDAFSFLQGQFTNELRQPAGSVTYGLWLNPKGKVVADSVVLRLAESEFLVLSANSSPAVLQKRLSDYIVADDVTLSDESGTYRGLILAGENCGVAVREIFGSVPCAGHFSRNADLMVYSGYRLPAENYEIIGDSGSLARLQQQLEARGFTRVEAVVIERLRIAAGIPAIPQDLGPADLPNEGGLEQSAVSFTKGCYLGQEIMARLRNLGQVRRRLHVVHGNGMPPPSHAELYQGGNRIGEIRSTAGSEESYVALAMLSLVNLSPSDGLSLAPADPPAVWIGPP